MYIEYDEGQETFDYDEYNYCEARNTKVLKEIYTNGKLISKLIQQTHVQPNYFCLATPAILIADVDCQNNIEYPLKLLRCYVQQTKDSFRIYKTKNGLRYIQTNTIYHGCNKETVGILLSLNSDVKYIKWCFRDNQFMARIMPKQDNFINYYSDRIKGIEQAGAICHYLGTIGDGKILQQLNKSIELHDFLTQSEFKNLPLV